MILVSTCSCNVALLRKYCDGNEMVFSLKQTRRQFLQATGLALGASTLESWSLVNPGPDSVSGVLVHYLDPEWGAGVPGCNVDPHQAPGCHACRACHNHARHKRFASFAAADMGRSHVGCKCLVRSYEVSISEYLGMFGSAPSPDNLNTFDDRRDAPRPVRRYYLPNSLHNEGL